MKPLIFSTLDMPAAVIIAAHALVFCASSAVAQSKPTGPKPDFRATDCEFSDGYPQSLKNTREANAGGSSMAMRTDVERDIEPREKEATSYRDDLAKGRRTFETSADRDERKRAEFINELEHARLYGTGGPTVLNQEGEGVKAAARHAVSAQSAATGTDLKLVSIVAATMLIIQRPPYELSLIVLKDGKPQSARASVRQHANGTFQLGSWFWISDANSK